MLIHSYRYRFLRLTEVIGKGHPTDLTNTDLILHKWLIPPSKGAHLLSIKNSPFTIIKLAKTLLINLEKNEEEIFKDIGKNTRAKIKRAMREPFTYIILENPTDTQIEEFAIFFNHFAKSKRIRLCDPVRLKALRDKHAFYITMLKFENSIICYHGYMFDGERAIMLYSASDRKNMNSSDRNLIGRANRYLHWRSILSFKEKGCTWYDFCGLSIDHTDIEGQGINNFKKGFGGIEVDEIKIIKGKSHFGQLIVSLCKLLWRNDPEYVRAKQIIYSKPINDIEN